MRTPILELRALAIGYKNGSSSVRVAGPINTAMLAGQLVCLLGPNGAGKSTLIRTIAGLHKALEGEVSINGKLLSQLSPQDTARKVSVVLTDQVKISNLDVYSLISLGRYPYTSWLGTLDTGDREKIDWAITSTHVEPFLNRKMSQLSDGECQKVMLARALAQDTDLIILDEPTAHLDLPSRIEMMRLLHKLAKETNKAIVVSTHELDLALQVADTIWLLNKDGQLKTGLPESLVLNGTFEEAFEKNGVTFDKNTGTFSIHPAGKWPISISGNNAAGFWIKRALIRNEFKITENADTKISLSANGAQFVLHHNNSIEHFDALEALLYRLKELYN